MRSLAIIGFIAIILCCLNSLAEDTPKIGFVDVNKVFAAYDKAKGISVLLESEKKKGRDERSEKEDEIRKAGKKLQEKESALTKEEKGERRHDIEVKVEELVKFDQEQRERQYEPIRKALEKIYQAVEKIGKREGFDLIIEKRKSVLGRRTILFARKKLDLTDKVIKELLKKQD